jgi:hypothetical protein
MMLNTSLTARGIIPGDFWSPWHHDKRESVSLSNMMQVQEYNANPRIFLLKSVPILFRIKPEWSVHALKALTANKHVNM